MGSNYKVFGHTRYSVYVPGAVAWQASKQFDEEEYLSYLYSDERMSLREEIFLGYSLPLIKKNLDADDRYFHLVEYSDELPSPDFSQGIKESG